MRRLSRPRSSDPLPEPTPRWCLSPMILADLDQSASTSSAPASPGVLYRSCFAQECEAVVVQLSSAAEAVRPRSTLTIQEETLTPLEPACSFLDSPDGSSRPGPESASAGLGPPDLISAAPCREQTTGLAGASPGLAAQLATASPVGRVSPLSELKADSSLPSAANLTYLCEGSDGSASATYNCPGSPMQEEEELPAEATSTQPDPQVCEQELPLITSTPLMAPPPSKDAAHVALYAECGPRRAACGLDSPPAEPQPESVFSVTFISSHGSFPVAASNAADPVPRVSGKASLAKRNLLAGAPLRARGAPAIGVLPKETGAARKIPQPARGSRLQNLVRPPTRSGSAVQSQPVAQKPLPGEITKTDVTKLPCNKKPLISIQPPFKLAGISGVQGSPACMDLRLHGILRTDSASGTRLPVPAGNKLTAKSASQKRPWEKPSDKVPASLLKQPFRKRSRLCKSQKEKPTCDDLLGVGQTSGAALERDLTAHCSQCQQLAEENRQLKSMLDACRKTIAFLEGKQTVVENENCPPQTEAT